MSQGPVPQPPGAGPGAEHAGVLAKLRLRLRRVVGQELLSLAGDASFLFLCRVGGALLVLLTQILLARWMGAEQLGWYVYAFAWCVFLSVLAGCGFPTAAVRFIGKGAAQERADLVRGYFRRARQVGATISTAVTLVAVALVLVRSGGAPAGGDLVLLIAVLTVPVFTMINIYGSVALAMFWFRTVFVPHVLLRPALLLIAVLLWYASGSISANAVMLMHSVIAVGVAVFMARVVGRRLAAEFPGPERAYESRLWLRTAPPLMIINLFLNYFQEVNVIAVGLQLEAEPLAIYNASFRIAFLIAFGLQAVNAITMPRTARLHATDDVRALQRTISHAARLQLAWAVCAVLALALIGKPLLAVFGPDFVSGYPALVILAFAQLATALFGPVSQLLSMTGHQDECLLVFACSFAAMLVLNYLLIGPFGIEGAAFAVVLTLLLQSAWLYLIAVRRLGIHASALALVVR